ncbi:hypothetical protein J5TS2_41190 [Brevibacillus halotolerans]|nr:hypothetical protein [Brevibacillus halotolerans]GIO03451.1 hypothetical protein J5TS2_41190 [Brevibacillus halotolerans]
MKKILAILSVFSLSMIINFSNSPTSKSDVFTKTESVEYSVKQNDYDPGH